MRYVRLNSLMAWVLFGACSCAGGGGPEAGLSKPEQITCQAGPDCDAKWARANKWVTESSDLKIVTKTDWQIKTVPSTGDSRKLEHVPPELTRKDSQGVLDSRFYRH
jgi:hypothetical protein